MAPSFGYKLEHNEIAIVDDFNQFFQELCLKHGLPSGSEFSCSPNLKIAEENLQPTTQRLQQQQVELADDKIQQIVRYLHLFGHKATDIT